MPSTASALLDVATQLVAKHSAANNNYTTAEESRTLTQRDYIWIKKLYKHVNNILPNSHCGDILNSTTKTETKCG